ncbi:MAG: rhomboid family protein [Verrucomicrobiales bacterium]
MSELIKKQRCSIYPQRAAVARCPSCRNYFSRECIVEHDGRVICARCLEDLTGALGKDSRSRFPSPAPIFQVLVGLLLLWVFFYFGARILIMIPSDFHEGTIWSE